MSNQLTKSVNKIINRNNFESPTAPSPSPIQYQVEIGNLKKELEELTVQLMETQRKLDEEEKKADEAIIVMEKKVQDGEVALKSQQEDKDKQIKDIITR